MSIRFEEVSKSFGPKLILDQVSFEVSTGEILFILGKSGMGKSVTLKHIIGMLRPDAGRVLVDDQEVHSADEDQLSRIRRKCGMVFQHPALLDSLTVFENVAFGLQGSDYRLKRSQRSGPTQDTLTKTVTETLALVNLGPEILNRLPGQISYGMQKRVSLARTLAPQPSYLLFDEPTTGLDPINTQLINDLIFDLSRKLQVTSIVVSHDMGCALRIADRILVLHEARILAHATRDEITRSKEPLIQDFLLEALNSLSEKRFQNLSNGDA